MKLLHLTDIHSNFQKLKNILEIEWFDLAILSGDITHFGDMLELQKAIKILREANVKFYAVTGNCDKPECETYLEEEKISLNEKLIHFDKFQIAGLSGSLPCPGKTPNEFSEDEYSAKIKVIEQQIVPNYPIIFVTHQPPYNTKNDKVLMGFHVGSKTIRNFIENYSPVLCLTGHIHEGKGIDYIGKTGIINPGPLKNGNYAIIELTGENLPKVTLY